MPVASSTVVSAPLAAFVRANLSEAGSSTLAPPPTSAETGFEDSVQAGVLAEMKYLVGDCVSKRILDKGQRLDGRSLTEIRELQTAVDLLPRVHGSAMFMRGDTQVLSVVTLGAPGDVQTIDTMEEDSKKRYMHHYNDTPFAYGEAGPIRGPGRRAIGHGALAERALEPVLPAEIDFPYAIRVVSEVMGSNGSSSMASTCGSTMSLMAAGVPIKKPVAGIAMGLASDEAGRGKCSLTSKILKMVKVVAACGVETVRKAATAAALKKQEAAQAERSMEQFHRSLIRRTCKCHSGPIRRARPTSSCRAGRYGESG